MKSASKHDFQFFYFVFILLFGNFPLILNATGNSTTSVCNCTQTQWVNERSNQTAQQIIYMIIWQYNKIIVCFAFTRDFSQSQQQQQRQTATLFFSCSVQHYECVGVIALSQMFRTAWLYGAFVLINCLWRSSRGFLSFAIDPRWWIIFFVPSLSRHDLCTRCHENSYVSANTWEGKSPHPMQSFHFHRTQ